MTEHLHAHLAQRRDVLRVVVVAAQDLAVGAAGGGGLPGPMYSTSTPGAAAISSMISTAPASSTWMIVKRSRLASAMNAAASGWRLCRVWPRSRCVPRWPIGAYLVARTARFTSSMLALNGTNTRNFRSCTILLIAPQ